jgi:nucleotide-binding universal stress UspA family protein
VREVTADLLVLGVHGTTGPGEGAGTLAAKCVRKAPTKVLLVSEAHGEPYGSIVACVDFSESTPTIVDEAVRLARQEKSRLDLLHVYYGPWHNLHYRAPTPEASPEFQKQYMATLQMRLDDRLKDAGDTHGLEVQCQLLENRSHGRGIVQYAKEREADLVVLGTHGATRLRYILLGCTAERVLRELPCSILAIKPPGYGVRV